jgi:hypothetical protein
MGIVDLNPESFAISLTCRWLGGSSCCCGNWTQSCVHRPAATQKFMYIGGKRWRAVSNPLLSIHPRPAIQGGNSLWAPTFLSVCGWTPTFWLLPSYSNVICNSHHKDKWGPPDHQTWLMLFKALLFHVGSGATTIWLSVWKKVLARAGDLKRKQKQKASYTVSSFCAI